MRIVVSNKIIRKLQNEKKFYSACKHELDNNFFVAELKLPLNKQNEKVIAKLNESTDDLPVILYYKKENIAVDLLYYFKSVKIHSFKPSELSLVFFIKVNI